MTIYNTTLASNSSSSQFLTTLTNAFTSLGATTINSLTFDSTSEIRRTFKITFNDTSYGSFYQTIRLTNFNTNSLNGFVRSNSGLPTDSLGNGDTTYPGFGPTSFVDLTQGPIRFLGYSGQNYCFISISQNNNFITLLGGLRLNSPWINTRVNDNWIMAVTINPQTGLLRNSTFQTFVHLSPNPISNNGNSALNHWRCDRGGRVNGRLPDGTLQIFPLEFSPYGSIVAPALFANIPEMVVYSSELITYSTPVSDGVNSYQTIYLPSSSQASMAIGIKL